jgi:hypothetical protein
LLFEEATLPYEDREYYLFNILLEQFCSWIQYRVISQNMPITGSTQTNELESLDDLLFN